MLANDVTFVPAYAGAFLRNYESIVNRNTRINDIFSASTKKLTTTGITIPREVQFPDVSFWQGEINWDEMSTHTRAVIIRIGQAKFIDTQFERNYAEAVKRGVKIGYYFFFDDRYSPGEQATTIINALQGKQIDMEIYIDWEVSYGGAFKGLPQAVALMQAVEGGLALLPNVVGMYTGYYWFRENSNAITNINQYIYLKNKPLWLAWYAAIPDFVLIPAPWTALTHWQFGTPTVAWGQATKELDMNLCSCTSQEFTQKYGGEPIPPDPDEGGNVKYKVTWNKGVARRTAPHTGTATQVTYTGLSYSYSTEVEVIGENIPDALDPGNENKRWVKFVDGFYGASKYPDSLGIPRDRMVKVEEPIPDPEPTVVHTVDIYSNGKVAIDGGDPI